MKPSVLLALLPIIAVDACLSDIERRGGHHVDLNKVNNIDRRQEGGNPGAITVGKGDRFKGGKVVPRGPGTGGVIKGEALSLLEIQSALKALNNEFGGVEYFEAPLKTYEKRTNFGISISGKSGKGKPQPFAFLEAGIHARERGGPDHLVYFVADLLWAHREKKGVKWAGVTYTADEVKKVVEAGIVILPVVNPDGLAFDQATNSCWRKNRNPASAVDGDAMSIGVDLNRNFDIAWNYTQALAPGVEGASNDPSSPAFYGTGPLSEVETQNVAWVFDAFPSIGWFNDLHSAIGLGLYGWCFDSIQTTDKSKNFRNKAWDGKRGLIADDKFQYREYMDQKDWDKLLLVSNRMTWAANEVAASYYYILAAPHLYPSTGCSVDHAYARHILDPKKKKVLGVGFEYGKDYPEEAECYWYPPVSQYKLDMLEVAVHYMEFLLNALRVG
ncbi:hypothetical protein ACHAQH_007325 [Verticillium albo-atrum]